MRQIRALVERGWEFNMHMRNDQFFYVSVSHNTWGNAEGADRDLDKAIDQMFRVAKELEKSWR